MDRPRGRLTPRLATASQARLRAALIDGLAGLSAAALPYTAGRAVRGRLELRRLELRRLEQWDAEWAHFGPQWGRTTG